MEKEVVVILNNIRSNENVGSIFRTADAAGVSKIFLVGITPTPLDRFGRPNKGLLKTSLGAENFVAWERVENLKTAIEKLKVEKFKIIGIEQDKKSVDYTKIRDPNFAKATLDKREKAYNLALLFGNEVEGLSEEDLSLCDLIAEIPMRGNKESLNVAVTVGIILYSINS